MTHLLEHLASTENHSANQAMSFVGGQIDIIGLSNDVVRRINQEYGHTSPAEGPHL